MAFVKRNILRGMDVPTTISSTLSPLGRIPGLCISTLSSKMDRSSRIQRAMYQSIYGELNKADVWNLQYSLRVKFFSNLYMAQVPGEEIHNSLKLMKQISFNVGIIHFIAKLCTSKIVAHKTQMHFAVIAGSQR